MDADLGVLQGEDPTCSVPDSLDSGLHARGFAQEEGLPQGGGPEPNILTPQP